ncbi:MAG: hypothetical protein AB1671_16060 [Thermodesulfobacteriota bacterium]
MGPVVGTLAGLLFSLLMVPLGINRAEWLMAVGAALGLFVGLMIFAEEEHRSGPSTHKPHGHAGADQ